MRRVLVTYIILHTILSCNRFQEKESRSYLRQISSQILLLEMPLRAAGQLVNATGPSEIMTPAC
jgi:hypothetical protein